MENKKDDLLHPNGLYNPLLRFAFTNVTDEDFTSFWNSQPIKVKAGQSVEVPHHLAVKMTKELVDKIMIGEVKADEQRMQKENPNLILPRSVKGPSLGVPAARKPYEDSICRQLAVDEESPEMQITRARIREELMADISKEKSTQPVQIPADLKKEFAELKNPSEVTSEPVADKPEIKLKKVTTKKKDEAPISKAK